MTGWEWWIPTETLQIRKKYPSLLDLMFIFSVDVNLKYQTYCNAIADGSQEEWDFAWKRYQNSDVASEKATILSALACTKEVWLLNRSVLS